MTSDWTRDDWLAFADRLLAAVRPFASVNGARITPPGAEGGYGRDVDGLEGFARTFLLAGFRIAGARGEGVDDLIAFYSRGIAAGVDPDAPDRWVRPDEHGQAKVEAASLALILDLTRPWIWDRLDETTRRRVVDYLAPVVGDTDYPKTNWLWFRVVVETFLRSVGGPWSADDIAADLALHDELARADGWISDGFERSYDHYVGWALHLYPVLWARMTGAADLAAGRIERDRAALDRYLHDAVALVGADGSPLIQGRSLIYRFAAAAPFWAGVIAEVPSISAGALRHAANRIVSHFAERGAPDDAGMLTLGWHGEWRDLAQSYSGPGSPYWAVKGLVGIMLPADHPVWAAPAEPLPIEQRDRLRAVRAAGWIVSGTASDGIVRIVNHGTDHAAEGSLVGDSPLYARLGYSTATSPLLDAEAWTTPLDQSVALIDGSGRATHRAAMELLGARVDEHETPVGVAASTWPAHWIDPQPEAHRHGSGLAGEAEVAGRLTVHSLVRGPWEVRVARADAPAQPGLRLRVGGWAVSGDEPECRTRDAAASATVPRAATAGRAATALRSSIQSLLGVAEPVVVTRQHATPLGRASSVPALDFAITDGTTVAVIVELTGAPTDPVGGARLELVGDVREGAVADVTWPDGARTRTRLEDPRSADADRHPAGS